MSGHEVERFAFIPTTLDIIAFMFFLFLIAIPAIIRSVVPDDIPSTIGKSLGVIFVTYSFFAKIFRLFPWS